MFKAAIFDLDNTLVDFMAMKTSAIRAAVLAMIDAGLQMSPKEAEEKINAIYQEHGIEYQKVFDVFLEKVFGNVPPAILAAGVVAYRRAREAALVPYPHVYQTLMKLFRAGIKLGVVSDAPSHEAWLRIAYLNLHHIFDVVITLDDTGIKKPSPEPFLKALELLNTRPGETIMVGDWPERDIKGAKELGIKTVLARYGNITGLGNVSADFVIDDIVQLLKIVGVV
jgi:putative hydrolase of the HAD superfamily